MYDLVNGVEDIEAVLDYHPIRLYIFVVWNECLCQRLANLMSFGEVLFNCHTFRTLVFDKVLYLFFWYFLIKFWVHSGENLVNFGHSLVNDTQDRRVFVIFIFK